MRTIFKAFIILPGLFFASLTWAQPQNAAQSLVQSLEKIETFRAHFAQKIRDGHGEQISHTKGEMVVRRPGKFYWKSQAPDPVLVVADGTFLWTYDIELAQVTKQKMKEALGNSPATILAGSLNQIMQDFTINFAKQGKCAKGADQCYLLAPKQKDAPFADIIIAFTKGNITEVKMRDSLGQNVHTVFSQIKVNQAVNNKMFAFAPPKGVDVIQGN